MPAPESLKRAFERAKELRVPPISKNYRAQFALRHFAGPVSFCESLDGIRIAHLSDQHFGLVTPERVQRMAFDLATEAKPDLIVITGDFVCHSKVFLDQLVAVISDVDIPIVGVLGNHDYWSGAKDVRIALRKANVELLDNAWTTIELRHQKLQIVGLDDAYTGHADVAKAVKGLDGRKYATIGLSHIAEMSDELWSHGVEMVYSGHTHAGQVTLASLHEAIIGKLAGHKYVHGLYGSRQEGRSLYVSAGIGAAVVPLRLGERGKREVTFFELGESPGNLEEDHEEQLAGKGRRPSAKTKARRNAAVAKKSARRQKKKTMK